MAARDDHNLAVYICIERDGHDYVIFFVKNVFVTHVAKNAFSNSLPDIIVFTRRAGIAIHGLLFVLGHRDIL